MTKTLPCTSTKQIAAKTISKVQQTLVNVRKQNKLVLLIASRPYFVNDSFTGTAYEE